MVSRSIVFQMGNRLGEVRSLFKGRGAGGGDWGAGAG